MGQEERRFNKVSVVEATLKQDDGNNSEDKKECWEIVVRYNGQGPVSNCRQTCKVEGSVKGERVTGSHTAI